MRSTVDLLSQYAAYHRDRRNIATHCVGVPLIVFAVGVLLARPSLGVGGLTLTPAWLLWAAASLWYLTRGSVLLGLAVSAVTFVLFALARPVADGSVLGWLAWGSGLFLVGWAIQFVGHYYEGRKPAFVDDLSGLLVGPMFVVAEWLFALGACRSILAEIERRVGPTVLRDLAHPAQGA
jgi:uncharacterized membrane protein YGL010W